MKTLKNIFSQTGMPSAHTRSGRTLQLMQLWVSPWRAGQLNFCTTRSVLMYKPPNYWWYWNKHCPDKHWTWGKHFTSKKREIIVLMGDCFLKLAGVWCGTELECWRWPGWDTGSRGLEIQLLMWWLWLLWRSSLRDLHHCVATGQGITGLNWGKVDLD